MPTKLDPTRGSDPVLSGVVQVATVWIDTLVHFHFQLEVLVLLHTFEFVADAAPSNSKVGLTSMDALSASHTVTSDMLAEWTVTHACPM